MKTSDVLDYCYKHEDEYIKGFSSAKEGIRQFECLISLVTDGYITYDQLADYGMEF